MAAAPSTQWSPSPQDHALLLAHYRQQLFGAPGGGEGAARGGGDGVAAPGGKFTPGGKPVLGPLPRLGPKAGGPLQVAPSTPRTQLSPVPMSPGPVPYQAPMNNIWDPFQANTITPSDIAFLQSESKKVGGDVTLKNTGQGPRMQYPGGRVRLLPSQATHNFMA